MRTRKSVLIRLKPVVKRVATFLHHLHLYYLKIWERKYKVLVILAATVSFTFIINFFNFEKLDEGESKFVDIGEMLLKNMLDTTKLRFSREDEPCQSGVPCVYPELVDFRIIVMTYSRAESLSVLLNSLNGLELDGHKGALEIWVDLNKKNKVHENVLETACNFIWSKGETTVHIHSKHVGIYGQWIDTWRPREPKEVRGREIALILEDDMTLSPYAYRWIRAVHNKYDGRPDYAGASLNGGAQMTAHNNGERILAKDVAFMYVCIGTWGFSPSPRAWAGFQDWYHSNASRSINDKSTVKPFHPYVPGAVPNEWYIWFEGLETENTMWEMWFIFYSTQKSLFTVYYNIVNSSRPITNCGNTRLWSWLFCGMFQNQDYRLCLGNNRQEIGLHYKSKNNRIPSCPLVQIWLPSYVDLPGEPIKYDWWGRKLN